MDKPKRQWPIIALLCVFGLFTLVFSIVVPIFEASDELWHYPMVEVIARTWSLPIQATEAGQSSGPWRQEASQPPLYYGIGAILTSAIDTSDMAQVRHLNPHAAAGEVTTDRNNANLIAHNPELESFPWKGTALAVHIVRVFSVLLGVWSVYLTWQLARELYPENHQLAWYAAVIQAFTPMYMFITSSVNNDNLVIPLSTLAVLYMVRHVKQRSLDPRLDQVDNSQSLLAYVGIGVIIALAVLTKYGALVLLPLAAAVAAWDTWTDIAPRWHRSRKIHVRDIGYFIIRIVILVIPTMLIAGWWFYRNYRLYGDWLGLNAFYAVLGTRDVPASFAQLWAERFSFMAGYWGNFGGLNVPMPNWIYHTLNTFAVIGIMGVIIAFVGWLTGKQTSDAPVLSLRNRINPFEWQPLTAARALAWAWAAGVLISWSRWATITWSSQGRLIFSSLPMWSLGLTLGLSSLVPVQSHIWRKLPLRVFTGGLVLLCMAALPLWIVPAYDPAATTTLASETALMPLDFYFGDALLLKGYTIPDAEVKPREMLSIELEWEALQPTSTDHSLFIHVVGEGGRIIAQRDSFPNRGLVPATQLRTGDTWRERYDFHLEPMTYAPDTLQFAVGLYETHTGIRQSITTADGTAVGDIALVGSAVLHQPDDQLNLNIQFDESIVLEAYDVNSLVLHPGDQLEVTLEWSCTKTMKTDYTVSLQLIDSNWNKVAQSDAWPMNGSRPTSSWQTAEELTETRILTVSPDAPAAVFDLMLTLYYQQEDGSFAHLPIVWTPGQMPSERVKLTSISIQ